MDKDKLKQWIDIADQFQGRDFWNGVFGNDYTKKVLENISFTPFQDESKQPQNNWGSSSKTGPSQDSQSVFPKTDIYKNDFEIMIIMELPGVRKEDMQLGIAHDLLQIKGMVHPLTTNMEQVMSERYYGPFERTIRLPEYASESQISAKFINGLLKISFPRGQRKMENIPID